MKHKFLLTIFSSALALAFCHSAIAQSTDLPSFQQKTLLLSAPSTNTNLQLKDFSEALCELQNVETVEMTGHLFTTLPTCIAKFSRTLRELRLGDNKLTTLPDAIGSLLFLDSLDLKNNSLSSLPAKLFDAKKLRTLNLSKNQLTTLPDSIGMAGSLEILDLTGNQLTALPDNIANLTSLRILKLSGNKITKVPKAFPHLINLIELDLSNNGILPPEQEVIKAIFKGSKVSVTF